MFKVNLEKELIKQNKILYLPNELLEIKEYEKLGDQICDDEILNRIGLNKTAKKGREKKELISRSAELDSKYGREKIFHISQIESLCKAYNLRFLQSNLFKGSIDVNLSKKVMQFEIANNIIIDESNCWIAAPASSFKLQKSPKDPLFFYNLENDFYYLVHKWGNDLSIFRKFYVKLFSNAWVSYLSICALFIIFTLINFNPVISRVNLIFSSAMIFIYTLLSIVGFCSDEPIHFINVNNWNNKFE